MKAFTVLAVAVLLIGVCAWTGCHKKTRTGEETSNQAPTAPLPSETQQGVTTEEEPLPANAPATGSTTAPATKASVPEVLPPDIAAATQTASTPEMTRMREQLGSEVVAVTSNGKALMVEFMVLGPEKAGAIMSTGAKRYLIDAKSGTKLMPPSTVRTKRTGPVAGAGAAARRYTLVFDNSASVVKPGDKVSLVVEEMQYDGLTVK